MVKNKNKKSRFGGNQLKASSSLSERRVNVREEKTTTESLLIQFSLKDFDSNQDAGQNFETWQEIGLLDDFMEKMKGLSNMTMTEAQQKRIITIYDKFPNESDFTHPKHIDENVKWAAIKNIGGQINRVAGYVIGNVFYVVFLDKNHVFYKTNKKNT